MHQIGIGVLGPVFRTYEPNGDRLVAVKVFSLDLLPEQKDALAEQLSRLVELDLEHPSIVGRIAAGIEGHVVYLAEQYVAAESLDIALRHCAPASLEIAVPLLRQLAEAIDVARQAGVGHGTLHPRDIFVTPEEARATGFGIADALEAIDVRPPVRRPYSAPERVAGAPWGTPADVFTLGAVAHELLTGRRPAGTGEVAPFVGSAARANPEPLRAVVARALAEDPAARYASALAFADALERAAERAGADVSDGSGAGAADLDGELPLRRAEPTLVIEEEADEIDDQVEDVEIVETEGPDEGEALEPLLFDLSEAQAAAHVAPPREPADESSSDPAGAPKPEAGPEPDPTAYDGVVVEEDAPEDVHDEADGPWEESESVLVTPAAEGTRGTILPYAAMLVVGLLVGFLAGYGAGSRGPAPSSLSAAPDAESTEPSAAGGVEAPKQSFSEQAVEPAAAPLQPVSEALPPGGRLVIRSAPEGAEVRVNGEPRGTTPVTLSDLAYGTYAIELRHEGYEPAARDITLSASLATRELRFPLTRAATQDRPAPTRQAERPAPVAPRASAPPAATGVLVADTRPRGASVIVDGRTAGKTPLRLPGLRAGTHTVRFELGGYRPWSSEFTVETGHELRVSGSLERVR